MGDRSRAMQMVVAAGAVALTAGCVTGTSSSPARLPAPSTYASLTTTDPLGQGSAGTHGYVDPGIAEPHGRPSDSGSVFLWSRQNGPTTPFGPVDVVGLERLVHTDRSDVEVSRPDLAVVTTLGSAGEARAVAAKVRSGLPRQFTRYRDPRNAVVVLGSSVVVRGIRDDSAARGLRGLLSRYRGDVLVEGDRYGEGAIVTDLSCRPTDRARAEGVAADLGDYADTPNYFFLRPPWAESPLNREERLARSTYTRFYKVVEERAADDPETSELWFEYRQALGAGQRARLERLQNRIAERRRELSPARLDGAYDPSLLGSLGSEPLRFDARWAARVGRRMGQLPVRWHGSELVALRERHFSADPAILYVRLAHRLDISMFLPMGHFAPNLAALVLHLHRAGCTDVRYRPLDWDTVRAD